MQNDMLSLSISIPIQAYFLLLQDLSSSVKSKTNKLHVVKALTDQWDSISRSGYASFFLAPLSTHSTLGVKIEKEGCMSAMPCHGV